MKKNKFKKAFTLIEILVATAIFAMMMVIVVGTFSWTANYNGKLHETRRVAQNGRLVASDVVTNVRLANGTVNISASAKIGEITLFFCPSAALTSCKIVGNDKPIRYKSPWDAGDLVPTAFQSNAILILQKDQNKAVFYRTDLASGSTVNYRLTKQEKSFTDWDGTLTLATIFSPSGSVADGLNETTVSEAVYFGGYGPDKTSRLEQPFVEFYLLSQTLDYNKTSVNLRSKFILKTSAESRDYN